MARAGEDGGGGGEGEIKASGFTLHRSERTDTGYARVYAHYLSRLGVVAYEVRAARDGKLGTSAASSRSSRRRSPSLASRRGVPSRRGGG